MRNSASLRWLAHASVAVAFVHAAAAAAQDKPFDGVTVRVGTQSSQWADAFKKMAPEFTEETGITLEFDDISFDVMYEKLKTTFIGGASSYDMVWYDSMWTPEFAKREWVVDLSAFLDDPALTPAGLDYPDGFYGTDFTGNYPAGNQWDLPEGVFGIPWIAGFRPLYYRTDLLEKAGLVDGEGKAKPPATMDELLDYAQKLNDPEHDVYGYVMPAKQPRIVYDWSGFLWTYGGDFFDAEFKPVFNSEAGVRALETYIALGQVAPPGVGAYHITEAWTSYMQGHAALAWTWQDLASVARAESEIIGKFLCAAPPTQDGRRVSLLGAITASIPATAENPEAAFSFITWALQPERAKEATLGGATVYRKDVWDDPDVEEMYPSAAGDVEKLTIETGRAIPLIPEWAAVDQIIGEQMSAAFAGAKAPKEALDAAAERVEAFMAEAGYY
jgi:ABC-type glycerol-3-phosphate transport system substrate-binding protein